MTVGRFERQVRLAVVGGVLFLLFLAALSLVVLRNVASWGVGESEAAAVSRTRRMAERLERGGNPVVALGADVAVAAALRDEKAEGAAVYDDAGNRLAEATFLPDAGLSPARLPVTARPRDDRARVEEDERSGLPRMAVTVTIAGGRHVLRVVYDGAARAAARRNVRTVSWIVPVASLLLVFLVFPFFRRLMRPIDALTETARGAGTVVPGEPGSGDETERAIATFQRTIEELKRRSAELEDLRQREQQRADDLAVRAESLVLSTTRLERELSSQRELARLGEMSAGIAHEFRNATGTILGYVRLAGQTDDATARARHLAAVGAEAEHVARVTGDFLFFARPERLDLSPTDVGALVAELAAEPPVVTQPVEVSLEGSFGTATLDAALFRRALVNLVRNACEAATSRVLLRGETGPAGSLAIAIEDDGPGVGPELLPKLFTPFFSTKESGTGLGLALVAKIAVLHAGEVSVGRSAALGGARFVLSVPRTPPPAST
ncbi:MAG: sensor histidine kinase [Thermoanaerobaculia bacterium]